MKQVVSLRVDPIDLKILEKHDIKLNGDFVHQCVNLITEPRTLEVHAEDPIPDFRFANVITDFRKLYNYVKSLSENDKREDIVKALYNEYDDRTKAILMRMGNPLNADLYFDYVGNALKDVVKITTLESRIEELKQEMSRLDTEKAGIQKDLAAIKVTHKEKEKELVELLDGIPQKQAERDRLEKYIANLRGDPGYLKVTDFISGIQQFLDAIYSEKGKIENERYLNRDKFVILQNLRKDIPDLVRYLESDNFYTQSRLDEERKKNMELMEQVAKSNQEYVANDLGKNNKEIGTIISEVLKDLAELGKGPIPSEDRKWMESKLTDAMVLINTNQSRANNILRRKNS